MRRSALISFLSLLLVFACVLPGLAETGKLNLIFIGGDSDTEESKNNLFRNILLNNEAFQEGAEAFFIKSAGRDYSNAAAIQRTETATGYLSEDCMNVVGGYSHGGQSIFFLEMDKISDIYLIDACVSIGGKCSEPEKNGVVWADWIVSTVRQGVNVHLLVSIGKHDEPSGAKYALTNLKKQAQKDPTLIARAAERFGSQCVVLAIDARKNPDGSFEVVIAGGRIPTGKELIEWAKEGERLGAGEILLTSMDADGTKAGFDLEMTKAVADAVRIPVIASGGCGSLAHFAQVFEETDCDAALAASLFHFGELTVPQVKDYLRAQNIPVRHERGGV